MSEYKSFRRKNRGIPTVTYILMTKPKKYFGFILMDITSIIIEMKSYVMRTQIPNKDSNNLNRNYRYLID